MLLLIMLVLQLAFWLQKIPAYNYVQAVVSQGEPNVTLTLLVPYAARNILKPGNAVLRDGTVIGQVTIIHNEMLGREGVYQEYGIYPFVGDETYIAVDVMLKTSLLELERLTEADVGLNVVAVETSRDRLGTFLPLVGRLFAEK